MKWTKRLGIAFLVICALFIAGLIFLPGILGFVADRKIAAIKAQGHPISAIELAGNVPDARNAATVYRQAFRIISGPVADKEIKEASEFLAARKRQADPRLEREARRVVARYRDALVIAERAALRPECRYPFNWQDGPVEVVFTDNMYVKRLTILAAMSAVLSARDGKPDDAVRWLKVGVHLSESLGDEPSLTCQFVRWACLSITLKALTSVVSMGNLRESHLRELDGLLSGISLDRSCERAMVGERAIGIDVHETVRKHGPAILDLEGEVPDERMKGVDFDRLWLYQLRARADELCYLKAMEKLMATINVPYRQVSERRIDDDPDLPRYALLTVLTFPVLAHGREKRDWSIASVGGSRILLGLHVYRQRHGTYPDTLEELHRGLAWKLPRDPFSGGDFIYKRRGKGFVLYSIGPDLKDDGGAEPSMPVRDVDETGDIVWKMGGEG